MAGRYRRFPPERATQPEFCRRRGLPLHTFRRRLYARTAERRFPGTAKPLADGPAPHHTPGFLPVSLIPERPAPPPSATPDPLVLILDGRLRIAVAPGFDPETLRLLLDVIELRP